ncbi:MAG: DMT family transporter [Christensenellales bacterium]|nr:DMT family transporter [Christensenellales bacterium]
MIYLILAVVSSMLVSVCMRLSEGKTKNAISVLAVNYAMCALLSVGFAGSVNLLPRQEGLGFAVFLGIVSGAMFLCSFMLLQWNIRVNGVVLPATFMKLGVLVPTLVSMLAFGERPGLMQIGGMALALAAIVMIQQEKGGGSAKHPLGLIVLLLAGGCTDVLSKIYEEMGSPALKNHYLVYTFFIALGLCVLLAIVRGQRLTLADVGFGLLLGIPNYFSARFLLLSLADVPAIVVYPSYSVGTIVLVALVGRFAFGERLSRRQTLAVAVILAALVLLNL